MHLFAHQNRNSPEAAPPTDYPPHLLRSPDFSSKAQPTCVNSACVSSSSPPTNRLNRIESSWVSRFLSRTSRVLEKRVHSVSIPPAVFFGTLSKNNPHTHAFDKQWTQSRWSQKIERTAHAHVRHTRSLPPSLRRAQLGSIIRNTGGNTRNGPQSKLLTRARKTSSDTHTHSEGWQRRRRWRRRRGEVRKVCTHFITLPLIYLLAFAFLPILLVIHSLRYYYCFCITLDWFSLLLLLELVASYPDLTLGYLSDCERNLFPNNSSSGHFCCFSFFLLFDAYSLLFGPCISKKEIDRFTHSH